MGHAPPTVVPLPPPPHGQTAQRGPTPHRDPAPSRCDGPARLRSLLRGPSPSQSDSPQGTPLPCAAAFPLRAKGQLGPSRFSEEPFRSAPGRLPTRPRPAQCDAGLGPASPGVLRPCLRALASGLRPACHTQRPPRPPRRPRPAPPLERPRWCLRVAPALGPASEDVECSCRRYVGEGTADPLAVSGVEPRSVRC